MILNRADYMSEIERQFTDINFYTVLSADPSKRITNLVHTVVQEALTLGYINDHIAKFLIQSEPRIPLFYLLPKIHKPGFPPRGRLIISGTGSILEPLAQFLDYFLQPFVQQSPLYIKDTGHFISRTEGKSISTNAILVSLDVNALYTSIPHEDAYRVIADVLDSRDKSDPPTHFLLELLELILEKNFFRCGTSFYIQHKGVAMGSAAAPSIANLFMMAMEKNTILHTVNPFIKNLFLYFRFIDYIFVVLDGISLDGIFRMAFHTVNLYDLKEIPLTSVILTENVTFYFNSLKKEVTPLVSFNGPNKEQD